MCYRMNGPTILINAFLLDEESTAVPSFAVFYVNQTYSFTISAMVWSLLYISRVLP